MKYITAKQYANIKSIPRGRLTARFLLYVGTIIIDKDTVLLCKTTKSKYDGWQFPGGKILWSESLLEGLRREVLEETGYHIKLRSIIGIFQRDTGPEDEEFLRFIFKADLGKKKKNNIIDPNILESKKVKIKDVLEGRVKMQSKQMLKELELAIQKEGYHLDMLDMYKW